MPLHVQFDGGASTDADGDPLTYQWDFGDGSAPATGRASSHTYTAGRHVHRDAEVSDGRGGEDTATVRIAAGNEPPAVTISSPVAGQRFAVGETITLTGSATDPEDGPLPGSALTWEVIRHHDTHTHPFLPPTAGNSLDIEGPTPEDIHATATSHLEVILTATDSDGLSTTVSRDLLPRTVDLTFATEPPGVALEVAGQPGRGTRDRDVLGGLAHTGRRPRPGRGRGQRRHVRLVVGRRSARARRSRPRPPPRPTRRGSPVVRAPAGGDPGAVLARGRVPAL